MQRARVNDEEVSEPRGRIAPDRLPTCYLLSAGYDGKAEKAFLRLYEPRSQEIFLWYDDTNHLPYCVSKATPKDLRGNQRLLSYPGFLSVEEVVKFDAVGDENITVSKILASNPLAIGGQGRSGIRNVIGESWESHIRYYQNYIYDCGLKPGMPYRVEGGKLVEEKYALPKTVSKQMEAILSGDLEYRRHMMEWARLLQCPVPHMRRVAVDIEVQTSVANRKNSNRP